MEASHLIVTEPQRSINLSNNWLLDSCWLLHTTASVKTINDSTAAVSYCCLPVQASDHLYEYVQDKTERRQNDDPRTSAVYQGKVIYFWWKHSNHSFTQRRSAKQRGKCGWLLRGTMSHTTPVVCFLARSLVPSLLVHKKPAHSLPFRHLLVQLVVADHRCPT